MGGFILGFDNERKGVADRISALVKQTNIPLVQINILQAVPNTDFWKRLDREKRLLADRGDGLISTDRLNFIPTRPATEITRDYLKLVDELLEPSAFLERTYRYYLTMRPTRKAMGVQDGATPTSTGTKRSLRHHVNMLKVLFIMILRQGVIGNTRGQFWNQLMGMCKANPSRMRQYLITLATGENLFQFRVHEKDKFSRLGLGGRDDSLPSHT